MSKNYTGLSALYDKLSQKCKEVYEGAEIIDPSCGYEINDRGVFKLLEDGKITVDKLLDVCDVELDWYIPSNFAIEFILFIRLALGEEPENSNPKAHYFFADCIFQQPNVEPYFAIRGYDYYELNNRIAVLCTREFSKSTLMAYMFLYIAYHGKIPGFGKIYYMIYCGDSMDNNVKTTMKTIKKVFLESAYLKSKFEDWTLNTDSVEFVRKPQTKKEIENKVRHMEAGGKETEVPGRMKRTFTLKGVGAATGARGSRDALARPDAAIFDDLVPSESAAASEPVLKSIESTIKSDLLPGLNNNKNFALLIGTPYSKKDPVYSRIERKSWLPIMFPRGIVVKNGIAGPITEDTTASMFKSVWSDRHGFKNCMKDFKSALLDKEGGDASAVRSILQEHYLRISSDEDRMIGEQMIQWYSRANLERKLSSYNMYGTTDFTTSGSSGADMSGIAFWALGPNGDYFMLDLCLRRQELEQQYDELFRMNNYWRRKSRTAPEIGIEIDGQQKAHISALESKMILRNEWFTFARQRGAKPGSKGILSRLEGGSKHWRFRMMLPLFQNRKIWFPEELRETPDMRELMDQIKYATYTSFGTKCDDGADLISQLGMMETITPLPSMDDDDDYYDEDDGYIEDEYGVKRPSSRFSDSVYKVKKKNNSGKSMYDLYS